MSNRKIFKEVILPSGIKVIIFAITPNDIIRSNNNVSEDFNLSRFMWHLIQEVVFIDGEKITAEAIDGLGIKDYNTIIHFINIQLT